jgi:hypothetical protein
MLCWGLFFYDDCFKILSLDFYYTLDSLAFLLGDFEPYLGLL